MHYLRAIIEQGKPLPPILGLDDNPVGDWEVVAGNGFRVIVLPGVAMVQFAWGEGVLRTYCEPCVTMVQFAWEVGVLRTYCEPCGQELMRN